MTWRADYGEHFPCCAAIESIRAYLDRAYAKERAAQQEIRWLTGHLITRSHQLAEGTWPAGRHGQVSDKEAAHDA